MSRIRSKDTKPEMKVRSLVFRLGYRYRLHAKDLPGSPDLVFRGRRKAIFVHGCFWHMHKCAYGRVKPKTNAEFWETKRHQNMIRDRKKSAELRSEGWKVLVIWECETKDIVALEQKIQTFLQ